MCASVTTIVAQSAFKQCPMCQFVWDTPADFLHDSTLRFIGRQESPMSRQTGLMLFNHSCGTTLCIEPNKLVSRTGGLAVT